VAGQQFVFGQQEQREMQQLNRLAGLQANYEQQRATANASFASALGSAATAVATGGKGEKIFG
jgi:hypothetical protein